MARRLYNFAADVCVATATAAIIWGLWTWDSLSVLVGLKNDHDNPLS